MHLIKLNYFGAAATLKDHLGLAYDAFKHFCKTEKIQTSQPPFKPYHAPGICVFSVLWRVQHVWYQSSVNSHACKACLAILPSTGVWLCAKFFGLCARSSCHRAGKGCEERWPNHADRKGLQWPCDCWVAIKMPTGLRQKPWWRKTGTPIFLCVSCLKVFHDASHTMCADCMLMIAYRREWCFGNVG